MKTIVVTGGLGFIGLHLVKYLLTHNKGKVIVLDNLPVAEYDDQITLLQSEHPETLEIIEVDLATLEQWPDADEVYHLATGVPSARIKADSYELIYRNLAMLENLLYSYNVSEKKTKILLASSLDAVGDVHDDSFITETSAVGWADPFNAKWSYSFSKFSCEQLLTQFAKRSLFRYNIVRLGNVYGERMKQQYLVKELIDRTIKAENPLRLMNAFDIGSYTYVSDIVEGMIAVMESDHDKQLINLGDNTGVPTLELAIKLGAVVGTDAKNIQVVLDDDDQAAEVKVPDNSKAQILLQWKPKVSLEEGLAKTWKWYKNKFFLMTASVNTI